MIIRRADVTIQSIRAARAYVNTRGTGEPLTDAIAALIEAVADGHTVTLDIRSDIKDMVEEDEDQEYRKYCRGAYQLMGDYLRLRTTG